MKKLGAYIGIVLLVEVAIRFLPFEVPKPIAWKDAPIDLIAGFCGLIGAAVSHAFSKEGNKIVDGFQGLVGLAGLILCVYLYWSWILQGAPVPGRTAEFDRWGWGLYLGSYFFFGFLFTTIVRSVYTRVTAQSG